jgi:hypothetical protein
VTHSNVRLTGGGVLSGPLVAAQLASAREVAVVLATVGPEIADLIGVAAGQSPSLALALEGVATAALEASVAEVIQGLERAAGQEGWRAGPALNPGMEGWPLETGQRELFALLGGCASPVRLRDSGMMWPRHSLSLAVGLGPDLSRDAVTCDWCGARARCRHRPVA